MASINSNTITITVTQPAAVASKVVLSDQYSTITTSQTDTISAQVTDQYGNGVSGATVTFTDQTTNSVIGTSATNASGVASLIVGFSTAGSYTLVASVGT